MKDTLIGQIFRSFKRSAPRTSAPTTASATTSILPSYQIGGSALSVATVFRCVQLLSEGVARLQLRHLRLRNGVYQCDEHSPMHYVFNVRPDRAYNAFDFWKKVVQDMLLTGNAYIVPVYSPLTMSVSRLVLCSRGSVAHNIYADTYVVNDVINGLSGTYDEEEIIHLKNYTLDGKNGISTLASARTALDIAKTGDRETLERFANGGNVRGIVANEKNTFRGVEYADSELDKTAKSLDAKFRSGKRIVSLPGQVQWQPLSLSSTDMQFLESRKFSVREICRFFGVNPVYVFDETGSSNYKDAANRENLYNNGTLDPILTKIEAEFNGKLISPERFGAEKFEFDRDAMSNCDHGTRLLHAKQLLELGGSVNEIRSLFNLPHISGGDTPFVSANLRSLTELNQQKDEETTQTQLIQPE